jgi:hypothetical protein
MKTLKLDFINARSYIVGLQYTIHMYTIYFQTALHTKSLQ